MNTLRPDGVSLRKKAGHQLVPEFDGLRLWLCRIDSGLGELDFATMTHRKDPVPRSPLGVSKEEVGSSFRKHRHMMNSPKLLIDLLYLVLA